MRALTLISHGPPGSGPSLMLAALGAALTETSQVDSAQVIDLPGDDGAAAILRMAAAGGDELVAGSCTPTYLTTPVKQHLPVTYRDLTPLAGLVSDTYLLATRAGHPRAGLAALLRQATVAAAAPYGGNTHIQAMLLGDAVTAGVTVSFEPDLASAIEAVASGKADWTTGVATDFQAGVAAGRLAVVGSFADGAPADGPPSGGPPTLRSVGIDVTFQLWRGLIGPPALGPEVHQHWEAWLAAARVSSAWRAYLAESGLTDLTLPGTEFGSLLATENVNYLGWLTRLGPR
jgi:putative tricarboxylic transport membrane protein